MSHLLLLPGAAPAKPWCVQHSITHAACPLQELQQLMAAAAERTPSADAPPSFNTTHKDLFQAHNLEGLQ